MVAASLSKDDAVLGMEPCLSDAQSFPVVVLCVTPHLTFLTLEFLSLSVWEKEGNGVFLWDISMG